MIYCIEANEESVLDIIEHSKYIVELAYKSTDYLKVVDALSVNIKNAIVFEECDAKHIDKKHIDEFYKNIRKTRNILYNIIDKQLSKLANINNNKDNYDSMSKEELIALLRNK